MTAYAIFLPLRIKNIQDFPTFLDTVNESLILLLLKAGAYVKRKVFLSTALPKIPSIYQENIFINALFYLSYRSINLLK